MAIDTLPKRLASMTLDSVDDLGLPTPDGSFDQADRQQIIGGYIDPLWTLPVAAERKGNRRLRLGLGIGI